MTSTVADPQTARGQILAWGLWDWGSAAFNAVATTFVFTVYITGQAFGEEAAVSAQLGWALGLAGIVVLLIAPVTGQRSDTSGRRKLWLAVNTAVVVACLALMYLVQPSPDYLLLGLILLAVGTVFFEIAGVNYNAMLAQISTRNTVGRVSGFGWGMGYIGGIVLLLIVYFGFIKPEVGLFGVTSEDGLAVRVSMVIAALWFAVFALPVLFAIPELPVTDAAKRARVGFIQSYAVLGKDIARLWKTSRQTVYFLLASAVFRDGLTGVFTFGGVLAAGTFGFSPGDVIIFAIAANVVAGISTISVGYLDDRLGAKPVIITALIGLVISGTLVFLLHDGGTVVFWIFGLALCLFVGPAQSASRTFLSRLIPAGREGEVFGLYATTGRAATFLAPTAFALFVTIGGEQYWGILGIVLVLLIGLLLLTPVKAKQDQLS
ncbi:MFS transporter [Leifsonia flava]|uniref:MFS transporter n=1 Tax=Orlajensenia leifsoniae TaxID=2561933 RepID=A0A4Y9R2R1_9MICO|nr:MFS transporter [Leifsonia flava]TFV98388.1 MFS transporter [Leifsonia flava]